MSVVKFTATKLANKNKVGVLKPDNDGYYEIAVGGLNVYSSRGEYYTLDGAKKLFESSSVLMRRVSNGTLKGELGHPKQLPGQSNDDYVKRLLSIDEQNVCAHFKDIWLDTEYGIKNPQLRNPAAVAILANVKPSGPKGFVLEQALNNPHENACFSIRALTQDYKKNGVTMRVLNIVVCWDMVNEPGLANANKYDSPALESLIESVTTRNQLERILNTPDVECTMESKEMVKDAIDSIMHEPAQPPYLRW